MKGSLHAASASKKRVTTTPSNHTVERSMSPESLPMIKIRGRPSAFRPEFVEQAERLCLVGATDDELARVFNVSNTTINNWKRAYPRFLAALKKGRDEADGAVARALYLKALGGDVTACIFWLKNRRPQSWRDRKAVDLNDQRKFGPVSPTDRWLEDVLALYPVEDANLADAKEQQSTRPRANGDTRTCLAPPRSTGSARS